VPDQDGGGEVKALKPATEDEYQKLVINFIRKSIGHGLRMKSEQRKRHSHWGEDLGPKFIPTHFVTYCAGKNAHVLTPLWRRWGLDEHVRTGKIEERVEGRKLYYRVVDDQFFLDACGSSNFGSALDTFESRYPGWDKSKSLPPPPID
jgi:hypothetical protein